MPALLAVLALFGLFVALTVIVWVLLRRFDDDDGGGEPVQSPSAGPDGPMDWASFDRERAKWEHSRTEQ